MRRSPTRWRRLLAAVMAIGLVAGACGDEDEATTTDATPTATPAPPTNTPAPSATPAGETVVNVYWAWTIPTTPGGSPERVAASTRVVPAFTPIRGALEALLAGTKGIETEIDMISAIPAGTELLDLNVADGVATVDLSGAFEESGGTLGESLRLAQVVFTVTQFPEVERVFFRIDGEDRDVIMSHGFDVSGGVTRADAGDVRPAILLESPAPGAAIASPVTLRGEANTFEATLEYNLVDPEGLIIAEGFTTATAGSGTWGTFAVDVEFTSTRTGLGAVIVFERSAADGSLLNVVDYPVQMTAS